MPKPETASLSTDASDTFPSPACSSLKELTILFSRHYTGHFAQIKAFGRGCQGDWPVDDTPQEPNFSGTIES
jgi:hypothetical protein